MGLFGEPPRIRSGNSGWSRFTFHGGAQSGLTYLPITVAEPDHSSLLFGTAIG